jgi:hypothetical protein
MVAFIVFLESWFLGLNEAEGSFKQGFKPTHRKKFSLANVGALGYLYSP